MSLEPRSQVAYGDVGTAAASFQRIRNSTFPVEETVTRLKQAIIANSLWVLREINPEMLLARGGYDIGAGRQVLFFHPGLMARLLAADPSALLEAPLKFAIVVLPDRTVTVRWLDPVQSFARYESTALTVLARELSALCDRIADAALG
jgi:uncharacterized protein (DUF302 family)